MRAPAAADVIAYDHLLAMSDSLATFEHARYDTPRPAHGYCTDDMARVLLVLARDAHAPPATASLGWTALRFLQDARDGTGAYRNRLDCHGRWLDAPTVEDCWGRAVWGLGTAAGRGQDQRLRDAATVQFEASARRRSPMLRPTVFAALGAAELLAARPDHVAARDLLADAATVLPGPRRHATWPWPEPRLSYANAALPEALIAAGSLLDRPDVLGDGLWLLGWLLDREMAPGHLSPTPVGGAGPADVGPRFDQQPIEVAAMADACARAASVDPDPRWAAGVSAAVAWFDGANDGGHRMWIPATGAGYDGLQADGPNRNQGAESTLAALMTMQHSRQLTAVPA